MRQLASFVSSAPTFLSKSPTIDRADIRDDVVELVDWDEIFEYWEELLLKREWFWTEFEQSEADCDNDDCCCELTAWIETEPTTGWLALTLNFKLLN